MFYEGNLWRTSILGKKNRPHVKYITYMLQVHIQEKYIQGSAIFSFWIVSTSLQVQISGKFVFAHFAAASP